MALSKTTFKGAIESQRGFRRPGAVQYHEDFIGAGNVVIPAAGSAESGVAWVKGITGAAPPTVAGVADGANGLVALTLTSASQAQEASLYHGDQRNINILKPGIVEGRLVVITVPTLLGLVHFGLASDRNADPDAITHLVGFKFGTGNIFAEMDDATTDSSVDTGTAVVVNDVICWKIDFSSITSVEYYLAKNPVAGAKINYNRVASTTQFNYAATGANAVLQPFFAVSKASGAGLGVVHVDNVDIVTYR